MSLFCVSPSQIVGGALLVFSLGNTVSSVSPFQVSTFYSDNCSLYKCKSISLGEEQQKNYTKLNELASYKSDWNGNGADPFLPELIEKCKEIINELTYQPEIYPTAIDAIQFEYNKPDGSYIEFEIYLDKANVYQKDASGNESTRTISLNEVKKEVDAFYESK